MEERGVCNFEIDIKNTSRNIKELALFIKQKELAIVIEARIDWFSQEAFCCC